MPANDTETTLSTAEYNTSGDGCAEGNYMTGLTDMRGNKTTYGYNRSKGLLTSTTDASGHTVNYIYDSKNRLQKVQSGNVYNEYLYDSMDRLSGIKHNGGQVQYTFGYDSFSRRTSVKVGNRTLSTNAFNSRGLLSSMTYGNGAVVNYSYDNQDRLKEKWFGSGAKESYAYDYKGRLGRVIDGLTGRELQYTYDFADRAVEVKELNSNRTVRQLFRTTYEDKTNRVTENYMQTEGVGHTFGYIYGDLSAGQKPDWVYGVKMDGNETLRYTYDAYGHRTKTEIKNSAGNWTSLGIMNYSTDGRLISANTDGTLYYYMYDENNNLKQQYMSSWADFQNNYIYDNLNQLTRANIRARGVGTYTYTYDNGGNITSKNKYAYTTGELGEALETITYEYGDAQWKDLLTKYNGQTITYDGIGNPLQYRDGMTMTWVNGRQLSTVHKGSDVISYTYNHDGIRTSKTVNGVTTEYFLNGSTIVAEKTNGKMLTYLFDESGSRFGFTYDGNTYYYRYNPFGDVETILDSTGNWVLNYYYDAWGNVVEVTGTMASTIGALNPIRYRGYYFDAETGFYYLQSRYYDPTTCRFINADGIIGANGDMVAYNLFAYCSNNPINHADPSGAGIPNGTNPWDHLPSANYIHNAVQRKFVELHPSFIMEYSTPSGGRMDLYNPMTGDAYEVKPFGSYLQGQMQLQGYINDMNGNAHRGPAFQAFSFQYAIFQVSAYDMGAGIICYYFKINASDELYNTYMKGYPNIAEKVGYSIVYGTYPKKKSSSRIRIGYYESSNYSRSYNGYNEAVQFGTMGGAYSVLWDYAFVLS